MQTELKYTVDFEKIHAEISKLIAETLKINAETNKITRETVWYPLAIATGLVSAVTAVILTLVKVLT